MCCPKAHASPGGDAGFWACSESLAVIKFAVPDNSFKLHLLFNGTLDVAFNIRDMLKDIMYLIFKAYDTFYMHVFNTPTPGNT